MPFLHYHEGKYEVGMSDSKASPGSAGSVDRSLQQVINVGNTVILHHWFPSAARDCGHKTRLLIPPSSCDTYMRTFVKRSQNHQGQRSYTTALLTGWRANTRWTHIKVSMNAHGHADTPIQKHTCVYKCKRSHTGKKKPSAHFTSVFLLFTTAAVRVSWRAPALAVALSMDFLAKC